MRVTGSQPTLSNGTRLTRRTSLRCAVDRCPLRENVAPSRCRSSDARHAGVAAERAAQQPERAGRLDRRARRADDRAARRSAQDFEARRFEDDAAVERADDVRIAEPQRRRERAGEPLGLASRSRVLRELERAQRGKREQGSDAKRLPHRAVPRRSGSLVQAEFSGKLAVRRCAEAARRSQKPENPTGGRDLASGVGRRRRETRGFAAADPARRVRRGSRARVRAATAPVGRRRRLRPRAPASPVGVPAGVEVESDSFEPEAQSRAERLQHGFLAGPEAQERGQAHRRPASASSASASAGAKKAPGEILDFDLAVDAFEIDAERLVRAIAISTWSRAWLRLKSMPASAGAYGLPRSLRAISGARSVPA